MPNAVPVSGVYTAVDNWTSGDTTTVAWRTWNTYTYTASPSVTSVTVFNNTWRTWNQNLTINGGTYSLQGVTGTPATPEQIAEQAERSRVWREQQAELVRKHQEEYDAARAKAKALLEGCLTSEEIAQLARDKWFEVLSQKGNVYRIYDAGQSRNVRRVVNGRETTAYCIHPTEGVPDYDCYLAQKLMLETDEDSFERIANKS